MREYAVIMAGGGGTRLWPLSRTGAPKQFQVLNGNTQLLVDTINRLDGIIDERHTVIVGNERHRDTLLGMVGNRASVENILFEPVGRNTAACIALAAVHIESRGGGVMCILPSDHYIGDVAAFRKCLKAAIDAAERSDSIVTLGINPTYASTGYGYLHFVKPVSGINGAYAVTEFIEKPTKECALSYIREKNYLWNSGMFIAKASKIVKSLQTYLPDLYRNIKDAYEEMRTGNYEKYARIYAGLQNISIDYGVMEKSSDLIVIPGDFDWSDVGCFDAIRDITPKDQAGNAVTGTQLLALDSHNLTVLSNKKLVAAVEMDDIIVVDTDDALYLCRRGASERTKEILSKLRQWGLKELE